MYRITLKIWVRCLLKKGCELWSNESKTWLYSWMRQNRQRLKQTLMKSMPWDRSGLFMTNKTEARKANNMCSVHTGNMSKQTYENLYILQYAQGTKKQGRNEGCKGDTMPRAPRSPNSVTTTFFNTVPLGSQKTLCSNTCFFPRRRLSSVCPCQQEFRQK